MGVEELATARLEEYLKDKKIGFEAGDWIIMRFGFDDKLFYVKNKFGKRYELGRKSWLNSSTIWVREDDLFSPSYDPSFVGKGKKRWWRWLFPIINSCICPYSSPKGY